MNILIIIFTNIYKLLIRLILEQEVLVIAEVAVEHGEVDEEGAPQEVLNVAEVEAEAANQEEEEAKKWLLYV